MKIQGKTEWTEENVAHTTWWKNGKYTKVLQNGKKKLYVCHIYSSCFSVEYSKDKRLKYGRKQTARVRCVVNEHGGRCYLCTLCSAAAAAFAGAVDVHCALSLPAVICAFLFALQETSYPIHSFFSIFNSHLFTLRVLKFIQLCEKKIRLHSFSHVVGREKKLN